MVTILLALLAASLGGAIGAFAGFFLIYGLGLLTGADTQQGALAMGAATTGLPIGTIIGALVAAILVIVVRRNKGASEQIGHNGWIALVIVSLSVAGFSYWFFDDGLPPEYGLGKSPYLTVELRIPANDPDLASALELGSNLGNEQVYYGTEKPMQLVQEENYAVLKGRHLIGFKTEDRHIYIWLGYDRRLIFDVDLPRKPTPTEFTGWRPVTRVEPGGSGTVFVPEGGHDYHIRYKVEGP